MMGRVGLGMRERNLAEVLVALKGGVLHRGLYVVMNRW